MSTIQHRAFISHSSTHKRLANEIKDDLEGWQIKAFVAHEDTKAGEDWRQTIKKKLLESDSLIVLLTKDFRKKAFANQEVGFALCMNEQVPSSARARINILPISPHEGHITIGKWGFLADYQVTFWANDSIFDRQEMSTALAMKILGDTENLAELLIARLQVANTFAEANAAATLLPHLTVITDEQVDRLVAIFNDNDQVHFAYELIPRWQDGNAGPLAERISELTGRRLEFVVHEREKGGRRRNELRETFDE